MKHILLVTLCLGMLSCQASRTDSLFQRHQVSISLANGMSQTFFSDPGSRPTAIAQYQTVAAYPIGQSYHSTYLPLYAMHLQLHYSLGLTRAVRLETGIGYLFSSYLVKEHDIIEGDFFYENMTYNRYYYTGSITLPLYIKYTKATHHGAFTCTAGPDFALPVHYFWRVTVIVNNNVSQPNESRRIMLKTNATGHNATMGLYLKLGYEKSINHNLSVNVGPVVDFYNLMKFHSQDLQAPLSSYTPYSYYLGLDVAINFGFRK